MSRKRESENEDDPEPFEDSGDEWDVEKAKKEEGGRRKSTRTPKKPKRPVVDESGSDFDEGGDMSDEDDYFSEEEEEPAPKKRKGAGGGSAGKKSPKKTPKKQIKKSNDSELEEEDEEEKDDEGSDSDSGGDPNNPSRGVHRKFIPKTIYSEDYATGSFVILKKDAQGGDPSKHPMIWRIDGKALLQKYEAFDEEEKVRHKNTSIYTGWSPLDKDLYAPITVDVIRHNNNNLTVEVQWDKLKIINADSD